MMRLRSQEGVTVLELMVACGVGAIVLAAVTLAFQTGQTTALSATNQAEAQQKARWGIERMIQEIRQAGLDPCTTPRCAAPPPHFDAITDQGPATITIQNDFNGNGLIDAPAGACDPTAVTEKVRYQLTNNQLYRSTNPANAACDTPAVSGVTTLSFTYLDENGTVTATASAIRTVVVSVTMRSETGGPVRSIAMADRVRIRNR
jgi:type IV pilus assembly protein PilW